MRARPALRLGHPGRDDLGLTRPIGVLMAIPVAIEAIRTWETHPGSERLVRGGACCRRCSVPGSSCCGPDGVRGSLAADAAAELGPARGGFVDPFTRVWDGIHDLFDGDRFGSGLHVLWIAVFVVLLVVVCRRLPVSYGAYAGAVIVVSMSAREPRLVRALHDERVPVDAGGGVRHRRPRGGAGGLVLSAAGLVGYSVLAFLGVWVP